MQCAPSLPPATATFLPSRSRPTTSGRTATGGWAAAGRYLCVACSCSVDWHIESELRTTCRAWGGLPPLTNGAADARGTRGQRRDHTHAHTHDRLPACAAHNTLTPPVLGSNPRRWLDYYKTDFFFNPDLLYIVVSSWSLAVLQPPHRSHELWSQTRCRCSERAGGKPLYDGLYLG